MSKQYNKVIKRSRRQRYLRRLKAKNKQNSKVAPPASANAS